MLSCWVRLDSAVAVWTGSIAMEGCARCSTDQIHCVSLVGHFTRKTYTFFWLFAHDKNPMIVHLKRILAIQTRSNNPVVDVDAGFKACHVGSCALKPGGHDGFAQVKHLYKDRTMH